MTIEYKLHSDSISKIDDVVNFVLSVDRDFSPPLHKRVESLEDYVRKVKTCGEILLAVEDDLILGLIFFYSNDHSSHVAYISLLAVRASARGRNISTNLLAGCANHARACGMKKISVQSEADNVIAEKMYKKNGFTNVDEYLSEICGVKVIYEKLL